MRNEEYLRHRMQTFDKLTQKLTCQKGRLSGNDGSRWDVRTCILHLPAPMGSPEMRSRSDTWYVARRNEAGRSLGMRTLEIIQECLLTTSSSCWVSQLDQFSPWPAANVNTLPSFSHQRGIHVGDLLQAAVLCSDSLDPRGGSLKTLKSGRLGNAEQLGNRTAQIIHRLRERRTSQAWQTTEVSILLGFQIGSFDVFDPGSAEQDEQNQHENRN